MTTQLLDSSRALRFTSCLRIVLFVPVLLGCAPSEARACSMARGEQTRTAEVDLGAAGRVEVSVTWAREQGYCEAWAMLPVSTLPSLAVAPLPLQLADAVDDVLQAWRRESDDARAHDALNRDPSIRDVPAPDGAARDRSKPREKATGDGAPPVGRDESDTRSIPVPDRDTGTDEPSESTATVAPTSSTEAPDMGPRSAPDRPADPPPTTNDLAGDEARPPATTEAGTDAAVISVSTASAAPGAGPTASDDAEAPRDTPQSQADRPDPGPAVTECLIYTHVVDDVDGGDGLCFAGLYHFDGSQWWPHVSDRSCQ